LIALSATLVVAAPARAQTPLGPGEIARVADTPILQADYDHWFNIVARSLAVHAEDFEVELRPQVMQRLIMLEWIEGEAARQGIGVSPGAVTTVFRRSKRESFPREADYRRFLRTTGQTVADVRRRVRSDMLWERLQARAVRGAKTDRGTTRRLARFEERFTARWRAVTVCDEDYDSRDECGTLVSISA
jgi:foldase protein PrsA